MATNLREALTDEIALEGLDGITIQALWIRLSERENFNLALDDSSKSYLWNCVLDLKGIEFYKLSKPRPDLISYNRFHYIDPETKHNVETEHIPDDIYPLSIVEEDGVFGSCVEYKSRKNITEDINGKRPTLNDVIEEFGNTLVIVASLKLRQRALIGEENDPDFEFDSFGFCILERIGRSRSSGEASNGKLSLQVFNESPKTMFYMMKKLRKLKVLKKQRVIVVKKLTNMKTNCFLYHLHRFYQEVGNRVKYELMNLIDYLSKKPEGMEEVLKVKSDLKLFNVFKKVSQYTLPNGERCFEFLDVPWRERYPEAKPKEYLMKNNRVEKKIRHICLLKGADEVAKLMKTEADKDSEEEEEEGEEVASNNATKLQYKKVFDEPNLYQVMQLISQAGARGLSQVDLQVMMKAPRLAVRRIVVFLQKAKYVTTVLEDRGRQKTIMYVDAQNAQGNAARESVKEELKKFQNDTVEPAKSVEEEAEPETPDKPVKSRKKVKKEIPKMTFNEEKPTEDKVTEIKKELSRLEENQLINISPKRLAVKREIMKELQQDAGVKVVIEELIPEPLVDKKSGKVTKGMDRFGSMLTESHVRRANWILEVISAITILENFRLLKLLRNREKEINLTINMDQKSLKRLVYALCEEGKMKSYKATITMDERTKEFIYLCASTIKAEDEQLLRMIDEAKLRYFSVSQEDLRNHNMLLKAQAKADAQAEKEKKKDVEVKIPKSAIETIRSHQEYRRKLLEKAPAMIYDRKAGQKYGLLPKMLRIQAAHQYLFYLCYDTHGKPLKSAPKGDLSKKGQEKNGSNFTSKAECWDAEDRLDMTGGHSQSIENEPIVYNNELSWRRYLPPVPVHSGYPRGWVLISDCLLNMPVCLLCEVVNVCYKIEGLEEVLAHPKKKFYPVINLPFTLTQQLLHSKKYVQSFSTLCCYLAEMGLLSFGREVLKEKDQMFIYLHHNASLLDTKESLKGYNKVRAPEGHIFPSKSFHFAELSDLQNYWEFLQVTAVNSNLGHKSMVHEDLEDDVSFEVKSLKQASAAHSPETVEDDGVIPGDRRGGSGLDSSIFSHTLKNWSNSGVLKPPRKYKRTDLAFGLKGGMDIESKREVVGQYNKNRLKGKDRLILSDNLDKPVALKKVTRETKGNKGGKGLVRRDRTEVTKTHKIISRTEGKMTKKRCIKIPGRVQKRKKPHEKGDEKDKDIYRERCKMRVVWSSKEDSVLLMCRLATLIMDNKKKIALISYTRIRDYLHDKCGAISSDKTSQAVQRRIKFVLKNPQTETNLLLYYREAMQDEFVLTNYVSKEFITTDEDLEPKFRKLVEYLLDKFKSLDLQKCSLPDTLDDLRQNYTIQYIGKLQPRKLYHDVKNKADICQDVLRNILHSAVLLQDKQARTHEMFKLLSQYPDALLSAVVRELRADGLFVINKKNYQREAMNQMQTGMGLRNFKVSQRYIYQFKHRYLSAMFEESAKMLTKICDKHLHGDGDDKMLTLPFDPKSGECATLFPLILNRLLDVKIQMPQELVIVDMDGFYKFPWGRGKNSSSQTKGDKVLKDLKLPHLNKDKQTEVKKSEENISKASETDIGEKDRIGKESGVHTDTDKPDKETGVADKEDEDLSEYESNNTEESDIESAKVPFKKEMLSEMAGETGKQEKELQKTSKDANSSDKLICEEKEKESNQKDKEQVDIGEEGVKPTGDEANRETSKEDMPSGSTHISTNHCTVILPDMDQPEQSGEQYTGTVSGIASRTLLSLRRAEDCSFEDIRIFNAQDNFVVNSCEIGIMIRDKLDEGKAGNASVEKVETRKTKDSDKKIGNKDKANPKETGKDDQKEGKTDPEQEGMSQKEKLERISKLLPDKDKIRNIYTELHKLIPFQINMEEVWTRIKEYGTSEDKLNLYKNVFNVIDGHGELGMRLYDLKSQYNDSYPWKEALDILINHAAVLKVGVTCTRYVSLNNARPWVIHAYRNIRGRGLHVEEDTDHVVPIVQVDESDTKAPQDELPYLYSEPASIKPVSPKESLGDDKITIQEENVNNKTKAKEERNQKKRKLNSEKNLEGKITQDGSDKTDAGNESTSLKRKISIGDETETSVKAKKKKVDSAAGTEDVVKDKTDADYNTKEATEKVEDQKALDSYIVIEPLTGVNWTVDSGKDLGDTTEDKTVAETSSEVKAERNAAVEVAETSRESVDKMQTRKIRKRKLSTDSESKNGEEALAVSTYDKVRLVIQPWRKPEGGINKSILKMMLESVLLYLMMNPGSPEDVLVKRYAPYLQPMILRNVVDILEDIGCVKRHYIRKTKATLFSKPSLPTLGGEDEEDSTILMVPEDDCVLKMGLFGQEVFPNAKWPENTYPQRKNFTEGK